MMKDVVVAASWGRGEGSGRGLKGDAGGGSGDGLDKLRDSDDRYRRWWTGGITDIMQEADDGRLDDGCNRCSSWRKWWKGDRCLRWWLQVRWGVHRCPLKARGLLGGIFPARFI